jgi:hypothetical protein
MDQKPLTFIKRTIGPLCVMFRHAVPGPRRLTDRATNLTLLLHLKAALFREAEPKVITSLKIP